MEEDTIRKTCPHLLYDLMREDEIYYFMYFTGLGKEYYLICEACVERRDFDSFREVQDQRINEFFKGVNSNFINIIGSPEVMVEDSHELSVTPMPLPSENLIAACAHPHSGRFYLLYRGGGVRLVSLDAGSLEVLEVIALSTPLPLDGLEFEMSADTSLVVLYNTFGQVAIVYDTEEGEEVMRIDRGSYHVEQCRYPLAFIDVEGDQLLIHASDWNRLDITDVRTGYCLTSRVEDDVNEFSDYFHCGLHVSPSQKRVIDNGWVWAPIGVLKSWELSPWLKIPWHSDEEDGHMVLKHTQYLWDVPLTWVDDEVVIFYGFGPDDDGMVDAALIYDFREGRVVSWFPGPRGTFVYTGNLVCYDSEGLSVWQLDTGARIFHGEGLEVHAVDTRTGLMLVSDGSELGLGSLVQRS